MSKKSEIPASNTQVKRAEVSAEVTQRVAALARLKLSEAEVESFTPQLSRVLGYVESLAGVSTLDPQGREIEPMTSPELPLQPQREDQAVRFDPAHAAEASGDSPSSEPSGERQLKILKDAPQVLYDGFQVPPIL